MGRITHWPDARTLELRSLFRQGVADSAIAAALGVSVRAVIGRRQRLGLWRQPPRAVDGDAYEMAMRRSAIQSTRNTAEVIHAENT